MAALLEFRHVSRSFDVRRGFMGGSRGRLLAVDDVSLTAMRGETLGLVGESGCGKSTLARMAVRLLAPSSGDVLLWPQSTENAPLESSQALPQQSVEPQSIVCPSAELEKTLPHRIQMVFQDPFSSLNPRLRVGTSVGEPLQHLGKDERRERVEAIFDLVGLEPAHILRYPHEFSGGQRQRLAVARALITRPDFVVCDEAVSALDASVQAQILNLLKDMQARFGFTYLFISHDLAVVGHMSNRVAVMYLGRVVEVAPREMLFSEPAHPYTRALLTSAPSQHRARNPERRLLLAGELPSPLNPPSGCAFHPRCPNVMPCCKDVAPALQDIGAGRSVRCHLWAR